MERPLRQQACDSRSSCLRVIEPSAFWNAEFTGLRTFNLSQLVLPTAFLAELFVSFNSLDRLVFGPRCAPGATGALPTVSDGERRAGILHASLDNLLEISDGDYQVG